MDELVRQAMAKWPNVPHAYGWLGLGMRGDWYLRDEAAQAAGPFSGPGSSAASRGSVLQLEKLVEFIGRNYLVDEQGRWYFLRKWNVRCVTRRGMSTSLLTTAWVWCTRWTPW